MTNFFSIITFLLLLSSCGNKGSRSSESLSTNLDQDTSLYVLVIDTLTLRDKDKTSNIISRYDLDFKKSSNIPLDQKFSVYFKYKAKMEAVMKHSDLIIKSLDSNLIINKTSDSSFTFYLTPNYNKNVIEYEALISPHQNYAIKTYFSDKIYLESDTFSIVKYIQPVKE